MKRVFISAGHNGKGTGASGIFDEGEETIHLVETIYNELKHIGKADNVIFIDPYLQLSHKVKEVNKFCAPTDIAIDFHFNAFNGSANGTEAVVYDKTTIANRAMFNNIVCLICNVLETKYRGVKNETQTARKKIAFCSKVKCKSGVVEVCFCDNEQDAATYKKNFNKLVEELVTYIVYILEDDIY